MTLPTWDILIATIPHRRAKLAQLIDAIGWQWRPGIGVRVCDDNLQAPYGDKCGALLASSSAEYVSFADDDDMVAPDFTKRIDGALQHRPDYVGFLVRWTIDGVLQVPVVHSLRYSYWDKHPDMLVRDLVHFNPIRRELALAGTWSGGYGADWRWSEQVRAAGLVRSEIYIHEPLYYYQNSASDHFQARREPLPASEIAPLPARPWLTGVPPP